MLLSAAYLYAMLILHSSFCITSPSPSFFFFFFFNDTATTEIYTLSLHDALPISAWCTTGRSTPCAATSRATLATCPMRGSEEHTSELQSLAYLVCRLLLEKKKKQKTKQNNTKKRMVMSIQSTYMELSQRHQSR